MKQRAVFAITSVIFAYMLAGCGNESAISRDHPDRIIMAIDELPQMLACNTWEGADGFVYSNICHAIRVADEKKKSFYIVAYTNKVSQLEAGFARSGFLDSNDLRKRLVMLENYRVFVQWGFALMDETFPAEPCTWDFLLRPVLLMRREIEGRSRSLQKECNNSEREESAYIRKLNDHIDICRYYVKSVWYQEARSKMNPLQLKMVREKVRGAFGELPPEMAKDE